MKLSSVFFWELTIFNNFLLRAIQAIHLFSSSAWWILKVFFYKSWVSGTALLLKWKLSTGRIRQERFIVLSPPQWGDTNKRYEEIDRVLHVQKLWFDCQVWGPWGMGWHWHQWKGVYVYWPSSMPVLDLTLASMKIVSNIHGWIVEDELGKVERS